MKVKPNRDRGMLEKDIQRLICDYLAIKGYFFWRQNNTPIFGMSGSGERRFRSLPKYTPRGIPDIIVLSRGKFIGIEVKRGGMKLRPEQAEFGAKLVANGGVYVVANCLEQVIRIPELL